MPDKISKSITLRRFNNGLSLLVVGLALYILLWPFMPEIDWWLHHFRKQPTSSQLVKQNINSNKKTIPKQNTILIPRMELETPINDGPNSNTLNNGTWRRPKTSTPDKGGNTVIIGHRYTRVAPGIFYHLDKIQVGDPIIVYWQGKEYDYIVTSSTIVPPTQLSVENNTKDAELTLYTCTPMWTFTNRLVIIAKPMTEKKA